MDSIFSPENIHWFLKLFIAQCTIFILFLLDFVNFGTSFSYDIKPFFILISIYFWSIYRPTLLLPIYVFALGIIFDLVLNYPVGLHALLFVAIQWIFRSQRLYFIGQPYVILWIGFTLTCFAVMTIEWALFSLLLHNIYSFKVVLFGTLTSALSFPLITLLFNVIYRKLPAVKQAHFIQ